MPVAAVPKYLGLDFRDASPGMRFGLLLPIWTSRQDQEEDVRKRAEKKSREGLEVADLLKRQGMNATINHLLRRERNPLPGLWRKNDFASRNAWQNIKSLTKADLARMQALFERQAAMAAVTSNVFQLEAHATAPFTTGLGNEHPLENGFAFLNPYGLPYLPGSGVKGVLRQAVRELASGQWDDRRGWSEERRYTVQIEKETIQLSMLDVLFGRETGDGETGHVRGVLSFWDVIPQIKGDSLMVEIMTPHQGHYYQWEKDQNGNEIQVPPHDSGSPIPISFLTVPPGSGFTFHVVCDLIRLNQLAPELAQDSHWKTLLTAAFEHAFQWLGFGAKTVVGYGAMESSAMREARLKAEKERREREAEEAKRIQEARQQAEAVAWEGARLRFNRASKALIAEKGGKSAVALAPKGEELLASLPPDVRKKVEINQFVKVTAYVAGSNLVRVEA